MKVRKLPAAFGKYIRDNRLQWDRTREGAEVERLIESVSVTPELQWDRTREGAEVYR